MLVCIVPLLIGFSSPLTTHERQVVDIAKKRCAYYYPESPCLVKMIKKEEQVYNAVCGEKVKPK